MAIQASALRDNAITRLATVDSIDAKAVAQTTLLVVPTGKILVVDHIRIRVTSFTAGSKTTQAKASFGGNSSTYDDYLNSVDYTVAANNVTIKDTVLDTAHPTYAAGVNFKLAIETGSNATTETWSVDVFGYLL